MKKIDYKKISTSAIHCGMFQRRVTMALLLLIGILPMAAQEPEEADRLPKGKQKIEFFQRPFMMSLSIGPNFNTGGSDYPEYFGTRPDVATQLYWRMSGAFTRHWGTYVDLGVGFFRVETNDWAQDLMEAIVDAMLPGITRIKPSVSAGINYLAEKGRWQFIPRAGIGWMDSGHSSDSTQKRGEKVSTFKVARASWFANAGASFGYRTSKVCSFILDINYRYPLQACKATYTTQSPEEAPVTKVWKSRSWANDLSVSLGILLQTEMKAKK